MTKRERDSVTECIEDLHSLGTMKLSVKQHYCLLQIMKRLLKLKGE